MGQVLDALHRIENLLTQLVAAATERTVMADNLSDIRDNLQELNVDVDAALNAIVGLRDELADALNSAGVDDAARAEVMATIDAVQEKIKSALNPSVPVDPNEPEAPEDVFEPHPDHTLPGDLPPDQTGRR